MDALCVDFLLDSTALLGACFVPLRRVCKSKRPNDERSQRCKTNRYRVQVLLWRVVFARFSAVFLAGIRSSSPLGFCCRRPYGLVCTIGMANRCERAVGRKRSHAESSQIVLPFIGLSWSDVLLPGCTIVRSTNLVGSTRSVGMSGAVREIRTPDRVSSKHAFQACTLSRSDISPFCGR